MKIKIENSRILIIMIKNITSAGDDSSPNSWHDKAKWDEPVTLQF